MTDEQMKRIEEMRAEKDRVREQYDALERRIEEIDAAICEAQGDHLGAEWHRLRAQGRREEAHAVHVRMMAQAAIRLDCDPAKWVRNDAPETIAEIRAEVERLRSAPEAEART
jgi:predicted  nucleic acid-binding Zn-ribbon protein